jgi:hypothetical protein
MTKEKRKLIDLSFAVLRDLIPDEVRYKEENGKSDHLTAFLFFEKLLLKELRKGRKIR